MQQEKDVIAGLQRGDPAAIAVVWNIYYPVLITYGLLFTDSKEDIKDIISDTFLALIKAQKLFNSYENIKAFLYKVFKNKLINISRSNDRSAAIHETFYNVTDQAADEEWNARIENFLSNAPSFLEALSPRSRQVMKLIIKENLTDQQIADRLGISVENVYTVKSTAIKVLKKMEEQARGSGNDSMALFTQWLILLIPINYL